jgi:hypothetical protein
LSPRACDIFLGSNRVISNVPTFTNFEGAVDSFIFETKTTETQQVRVDDVEVRSVLWGKSELMAMADEPVVAPGSTDSDGDGLPDWWETEYFDGSADPDALAANGVNTLRQAYIAGLDPLDPAASLNVFFISLNPPIIGWNSSSGRVYNVYWTRALAEGFLPLETNISWLRPVFTNEDSETAGFFKIDVHESLSTQ